MTLGWLIAVVSVVAVLVYIILVLSYQLNDLIGRYDDLARKFPR